MVTELAQISADVARFGTGADLLSGLVGTVLGTTIGVVATWLITRSQLVVTQARNEVVELEKVFIEKPYLYPVFYGGQRVEDVNTDHRNEALAMARLFANAFGYRLVFLRRRFGTVRKWIESDIATRYASSPFLRAYLLQHLDEYPLTGDRQRRLMAEGMRSRTRRRVDGELASDAPSAPRLPGDPPAALGFPPASDGDPAHESSDRLWSWAYHEDALFDNRQQTFLTAHGLLLAAAGWASQGAGAPVSFVVSVSVFGCVLGVIWWVVQRRAADTVKALEERLRSDRLFREVTDSLAQGYWKKWSQTWVLSRVVPLVVTAAWILFFVLFVSRPLVRR